MLSVDDQGDGAHHHSELAVADLAVSVLVHRLDHILDFTRCQLGIVGKMTRSKLHFAINITINVNKMAHLRWHLHLAREVVHHKLELISWDATCVQVRTISEVF